MSIVRAADIPRAELDLLPVADLRGQIRNDQDRHADERRDASAAERLAERSDDGAVGLSTSVMP